MLRGRTGYADGLQVGSAVHQQVWVLLQQTGFHLLLIFCGPSFEYIWPEHWSALLSFMHDITPPPSYIFFIQTLCSSTASCSSFKLRHHLHSQISARQTLCIQNKHQG